MTGTAIILQGDARQLLLPDESVDLVVTSPPYFGQRSYTDDGRPIPGQIGAERTPTEYLDSLIECTAEMARVLKPSGSVWLNLGDKYAGQSGTGDTEFAEGGARNGNRRSRPSKVPGVPGKSLMLLPQRWAIRCVDELGLILRAEVVWDKTNGLPESVKDRVRRSHEHWFHLTKRPRYYCDIDAVRLPYDPGSTAAKAGNSHGQAQATTPGHDGRANGNTAWEPNPLGGLPPSVWRYPTQPLRLPEHLGVKHYATFPSRIVHRIVSGWCPAEICTACGQGRRTRSTTARVSQSRGLVVGRAFGSSTGGRVDTASGQSHDFRSVTTVNGQVCGCPGTAAPTLPGVVLDPFGGVGTTALVAKALDRTGISVDLGADYCRAARWRTDDPKSLAKAAQP